MANNGLLKGNLLDIGTHRKVAKIGMSVSLGVLTLTAFNMKNKAFKKAHIIAGISMVAFSLYHAGLYDNGVFKNMLIKANQKAKNSQPRKTKNS
ncbi:helicase [Campylobacter mucosalis]|uniref:helicase n=1 Tax=Campylobacter mucosalis TaxID=202 RepID=UPI00147013BD|nr:helicase [Campylobacter mucosalis]